LFVEGLGEHDIGGVAAVGEEDLQEVLVPLSAGVGAGCGAEGAGWGEVPGG